MATYVLIHGASSDSWYWHRVVPLLTALGHDVVAPDLPCSDDDAGFEDYADVVVEAIGDRTDLIVVAQSLGGFTGPLVCHRLPVNLLVLVAAMVPAPGESCAQWWDAVGFEAARRESAERGGRDPDDEFRPIVDFFHDVPADVVAEAMARGEVPQSGAPMSAPWPLSAWPSVPTRFLLCRNDRFLAAELQRRIARDRLGIVADEMPGGHLPALHHPKELVERLEEYRLAT